MLHVADAFHVMTSERPYSAARGRTEAVEELMSHEGTQFCPIALSMLADRVEPGQDLERDWTPPPVDMKPPAFEPR